MNMGEQYESSNIDGMGGYSSVKSFNGNMQRSLVGNSDVMIKTMKNNPGGNKNADTEKYKMKEYEQKHLNTVRNHKDELYNKSFKDSEEDMHFKQDNILKFQ